MVYADAIYLRQTHHPDNDIMLFATITKKLNRLIAPPLLKYGLTARHVLTQGNIINTPYLDYILLLPFSQALLSIEIQEIAKEQRFRQIEAKNKVPSAFDKFVDRVWDQYLEPLSFPTVDKGATQNPSKNPRLDAFQEYVRPILTPQNQWSDIERFRFNQRFIKWLRSEYLICKYESDIRDALKTYTQLKVTPLLGQTSSSSTGNLVRSLIGKAGASRADFAPLPNASTLEKAFRMGDWNKTKSPNSEYNHMADIVQRIGGCMETIPMSTVQIANVPLDASVKDLTTEELLEVSGCHVSSCNAFNAICEEVGIYEFWTQEYVSALANYLMSRCIDFDGPTVVVDVGAGDGILVHYLNRYVKGGEKGHDFHGNLKTLKPSPSQRRKHTKFPMIVATDDGSWKINPKASVEKLSVSEALEKYNPFDNHGKRRHQLIVICSWMPMGIDWTQEMRDNQVDEYILIGECDDGNCGDNWFTFGNPHFNYELLTQVEDSSFDEALLSNVTAPYKIDGYARKDLDELSLLQYSRFDSNVSCSSKTVSFRKYPNHPADANDHIIDAKE
jgi:hypothetical protein